MTTVEQYKQALIKAHNSGDTEAANLFANKIKQMQADPSLGEQIGGALDVAGNVATSALLEPVAGLSGLAQGAYNVGAEALGLDGGMTAAERVRQVQGLAPDIDTPAGQQQAQAIGEVLQPVGEAFQAAEQGLGDLAYDITGSPVAAAAAATIPTAAAELIGLKGARRLSAPDIELPDDARGALIKASPDIKELKNKSSAIYDQLDSSGIKIKSEIYDNLADSIAAKMKNEGIDPDLTKKSSAALSRILEGKGEPKTLQDLNNLRKKVQIAASDIDKSDARLGSIMLNEVDSALDKAAGIIGADSAQARSLWKRARQTEMITDMMENAATYQSGYESGLRNQASSILRNKNKKRYLNTEQKDALKKISQGDTIENIYKFMGRFGMTEGQAMNSLMATVGAGGGSAIGYALGGTAGAGVGALAIPTLGQIARNKAQKLTADNARYAESLFAAGDNAKDIVKSYLKYTPIKDRSVSDLTDLLVNDSLDAAALKNVSTKNKLVKDALFFAEEIKRRAAKAGNIGLMAAPTQIDREENE